MGSPEGRQGGLKRVEHTHVTRGVCGRRARGTAGGSHVNSSRCARVQEGQHAGRGGADGARLPRVRAARRCCHNRQDGGLPTWRTAGPDPYLKHRHDSRHRQLHQLHGRAPPLPRLVAKRRVALWRERALLEWEQRFAATSTHPDFLVRWRLDCVGSGREQFLSGNESKSLENCMRNCVPCSASVRRRIVNALEAAERKREAFLRRWRCFQARWLLIKPSPVRPAQGKQGPRVWVWAGAGGLCSSLRNSCAAGAPDPRVAHKRGGRRSIPIWLEIVFS